MLVARVLCLLYRFPFAPVGVIVVLTLTLTLTLTHSQLQSPTPPRPSSRRRCDCQTKSRHQRFSFILLQALGENSEFGNFQKTYKLLKLHISEVQAVYFSKC